MKNKFLLAVGLMFGMATLPLKAQVKIGFINADYILSQMPEAKQVEEDLKNTQKQYETLYQGKVKVCKILRGSANDGRQRLAIVTSTSSSKTTRGSLRIGGMHWIPKRFRVTKVPTPARSAPLRHSRRDADGLAPLTAARHRKLSLLPRLTRRSHRLRG